MDLFNYLDDLQLNLTVKRHHGEGNFDARVTHPMFSQPILTSTRKSSYDLCIHDLNSRLHAIENMKVGIERKNAIREKYMANDKYYDDTDDWQERIY